MHKIFPIQCVGSNKDIKKWNFWDFTHWVWNKSSNCDARWVQNTCDANVISFMLCNACMKIKPNNNLKNKKHYYISRNFDSVQKISKIKYLPNMYDTTWNSFTMTYYSLWILRFCNLLTTMQDNADTFTRFVKSRGQIIVVQVHDHRTGYSFFYLLLFSRSRCNDMSKNFNYCNKCWKSYIMWIKRQRAMIWLSTTACILCLWKTIKCSFLVSVRTTCAVRSSIISIKPFTNCSQETGAFGYRKTVGVQHTVVKFYSTLAKHSFLLFI